MSSIDESLVTILQASSAVTALAGQRIYPLRALQTAVKPFVLYQRISSVRQHSHDGPSGLARPRFQVRCVAGSYGQSRQLADAVRNTLDGYSGTVGSVRIDGIIFQNEIDTDDVALDAEASTYSVLQDYFVWHGE